MGLIQPETSAYVQTGRFALAGFFCLICSVLLEAQGF